MATDVPNPGSRAARAWGCKCPMFENNHGKTPPRDGGGWFIDIECPVHREHPIPTENQEHRE